MRETRAVLTPAAPTHPGIPTCALTLHSSTFFLSSSSSSFSVSTLLAVVVWL